MDDPMDVAIVSPVDDLPEEAFSSLTLDDSYLCKHNEHTAPWKSNANRERFAPFYENDADTNAKENYNATLETANYGFLPEYVERLARRPRWKDVKRPRYVTIAVDAAHGGKDEFAIVAGYTDPVSRDFVILYVDSQRLPRGDQSIAEARLVRAIDTVRQRRLFANVPILMVVENAPGPQLSYSPLVYLFINLHFPLSMCLAARRICSRKSSTFRTFFMRLHLRHAEVVFSLVYVPELSILSMVAQFVSCSVQAFASFPQYVHSSCNIFHASSSFRSHAMCLPEAFFFKFLMRCFFAFSLVMSSDSVFAIFQYLRSSSLWRFLDSGN